MKQFKYFLVLLIVVTACKPKQPNVLFILTDQWRGSAFGYAGDPNVKTPSLDQFAETALVFTNAVSVCPVCTPYRASVLTGRFPTSTGMFLNDAYLPPDELTLAEIYKENGYQTGYIGKWHLDGHGRFDFTPRERRQGFDYWKALECSHDYYHMAYYEGDSPEVKYWEGYSPDAVSADAEQYLQDHAQDEKPFFLMLSIAAPHFPHKTAPEELKALYTPEDLILAPNVPEEKDSVIRSELVGYYAHCTAVDQAVGKLLQKVEELDLKDHTLIVFTSDHGEIMGAHGIRETQKQVPWIESAGVPLLISFPDKMGIPTGTRKMSVTTPDLSATLLDLCGIQAPASFEGESFAEVVQGAPDKLDKASLYMSVVSFAGVKKEFKREYRALKTAQYTYVKSIEGPWLLYDDEADPYQMNNLVEDSSQQELLLKMDNLLSKELLRIGDDFKPAAAYVEEWGYEVTPGGYIYYSSHNQEPQSPKR